jgi:hypothetical protein
MPDCRTKLIESSTSGSNFPIGEQAHIIAEDTNGPRGNSILSIDERNSFFNLILLCPNCHSKIDKNADDYPVERLHMIKAEHEEWVRNTLRQTINEKEEAHNLFYLDLIDSTVEYLDLRNMNKVIFQVMKPDPFMSKAFYDGTFHLENKAKSAAWPHTNIPLEVAISNVAGYARTVANTFTDHSDFKDDVLVSIRFYKFNRYDPEMYSKLLKEYEEWMYKISGEMISLVKSLNWFADIVRADFNPMFFLLDGKFTDLSESLDKSKQISEYSNKEKDEYIANYKREID